MEAVGKAHVDAGGSRAPRSLVIDHGAAVSLTHYFRATLRRLLPPPPIARRSATSS
jgi:hypothetical protein